MLAFPLKHDPGTQFSFEVASGALQQAPTVFLISKVVTQAASNPVGKAKRGPINFADAWLEKAHEITSPFFKEFVSAALMKKFRAPATKPARKK